MPRALYRAVLRALPHLLRSKTCRGGFEFHARRRSHSCNVAACCKALHIPSVTRASARIAAAPCISASAREYVTAPPPCCPPACRCRVFPSPCGILSRLHGMRALYGLPAAFIFPPCYGVAMLPRVANAPACRACTARGGGSRGRLTAPMAQPPFSPLPKWEGKREKGKCFHSFSLPFPFIFIGVSLQ